MAALNLAITAALLDRRRVILAASALYGATINMLTKVLEPSGIETVFVDFNDEQALAAAIAEHKPGALLMETISNPLLRVAPLDRIAAMAKDAGAQLIVDSTFATPLIVRIGERFVVAQRDVEARPQPLDQVGFEQQRLGLGAGNDEFERAGLSDHALDAGIEAGRPRIGADASRCPWLRRHRARRRGHRSCDRRRAAAAPL